MRGSFACSDTDADSPTLARNDHPRDAYKQVVELPAHDLTIAQLFEIIASALPDSWQIAVLPGRAIMYPDNRRDYPSVWRYYRGDQILNVEPEIGEAEDIPEEPDAEGDED